MRIGHYGLYEEEDEDSLTVQEPDAAKQVYAYDKIFKENMEAVLPGLVKNLLNIHTVYSEEIPDSLQFTKEREPDLLKKVTDTGGNTFILHIEIQTSNEATNMPFRMAEYLIMLTRKYHLPVQQYVIYIGEQALTMKGELQLENLHFNYELINLATVDYHLFLHADKPEEKMLAMLANFGNDNPETVITQIATEVIQSARGKLEKEQRKNQLRILAQLRSLVSKNIDIMESISSFFKEENDIFYRRGERKGAEGKSFEFVKKLLLANKFATPEIVNYAGVTEDFVEKVKKTLN
jgi:hypothetical protein